MRSGRFAFRYAFACNRNDAILAARNCHRRFVKQLRENALPKRSAFSQAAGTPGFAPFLWLSHAKLLFLEARPEMHRKDIVLKQY